MEADFPTWEALHTHFPELCWLLHTHTQLIHALSFLALSYVGAIIVSPIFFWPFLFTFEVQFGIG
jgi:ribulose-5-phosphate 4-epimerase/fuculose-1-phosphate aldolase